MEYWEQFLAFEYANVALIALGALLLLWGILRILGSSIKLILWGFIAGLGGSALAYGLELSNVPINFSQELKDVVGPGKDLSLDAMHKFCEKIQLAPERAD